MDSMRYAKEAGNLIKNGPEDDEPSLLKTMVGVFIHWRMWAMMFTLFLGLHALTHLTEAEEPLYAGFIVGILTTIIAMEVGTDD